MFLRATQYNLTIYSIVRDRTIGARQAVNKADAIVVEHVFLRFPTTPGQCVAMVIQLIDNFSFF